MMIKKSDKDKEVIFLTNKFSTLSKIDIKKLKKDANSNLRKRKRICSHLSIKDNIHEMFIVHKKNTYIRPHKHKNKVESMYVIEGEASFITFSKHGNINRSIELSSYSSGKIFYTSQKKEIFHSLIIKSNWLVFLEITNGPFNKQDTIYASWAPEEEHNNEGNNFLKKKLEKYNDFC